MTDEHIQRWGWRVTEKKWVNYPDYRKSVLRDTEIRWTRPLHEHIVGCKTYQPFTTSRGVKSVSSQNHTKTRTQNLFYNQNFSKEMNVRR